MTQVDWDPASGSIIVGPRLQTEAFDSGNNSRIETKGWQKLSEFRVLNSHLVPQKCYWLGKTNKLLLLWYISSLFALL